MTSIEITPMRGMGQLKHIAGLTRGASTPIAPLASAILRTLPDATITITDKGLEAETEQNTIVFPIYDETWDGQSDVGGEYKATNRLFRSSEVPSHTPILFTQEMTEDIFSLTPKEWDVDMFDLIWGLEDLTLMDYAGLREIAGGVELWFGKNLDVLRIEIASKSEGGLAGTIVGVR